MLMHRSLVHKAVDQCHGLVLVRYSNTTDDFPAEYRVLPMDIPHEGHVMKVTWAEPRISSLLILTNDSLKAEISFLRRPTDQRRNTKGHRGSISKGKYVGPFEAACD
ncbi:hypothetical protein E2C01_036464 [Portunus trituberculatus]|uniref:Uncharacterized protein n=1 Tax=Portunus trituberculatus TaxID=210409 RepID=A0A5B7FCI9_PORTR|nr:hypothetical protein [Portunus trituberculatus]